jgi:cytoskeletal protein CcmA (bactofilin family)
MLKGSSVTGEVDGPGTTVGVNVALSGTLKDQNDIHIFGLIDGEVISDKTVTIGKTAQVKGPVRGQVVSIGGTVRGSIDASEKLELLDTAKVFGSIATKDLVIHSGAIFVGKSAMPSDAAAEEPAESEEAEDSSEEATESQPESEDEAETVKAELTPEEE